MQDNGDKIKPYSLVSTGPHTSKLVTGTSTSFRLKGGLVLGSLYRANTHASVYVYPSCCSFFCVIDVDGGGG